jgi:hypothetical protein
MGHFPPTSTRELTALVFINEAVRVRIDGHYGILEIRGK